MTTPMTWTWAQIRFVSGDEITLFDGWISSIDPNLAIARIDLGYGYRWTVTHVPSGWSVAKWFVTRGAAETLVQELAPIADWSQGVEQLRTDDMDAAVRRIRSGIYKREAKGEFGGFLKEVVKLLNRNETRLEEVQHTRELMMKARARREGRRK